MNWEEYVSKAFLECKKREVPFFACFELTPFCNFSCNMCYIRLTPEQARRQGKLLSTQKWLQLAKSAKEMGTLSLEITGGEPLTREDFPMLYKAFAQMGFLINLRTNGYLLNEDTIKLLKAYKPKRISITMYGASDGTYKKVCGIPDGYSVVTKNLKVLREAGFNIHLSMTVTKENVDDKDALKAWANENGFSIQFFGGLFTPIRGAKRSIKHLMIDTPYDNCADQEYIINSPRVISNKQDYMNPFWMCNGFGAMFCISWDGRLTLCNSMTVIWKDPFNQGLDRAYHELYRDLKSMQRPDKCKNCMIIDYCGACPTRVISESGSYEKLSDNICKRTYNVYINRTGKSKTKA